MKKLFILLIIASVYNCDNKQLNKELDALRSENYELKQIVEKTKADSIKQITTFLTFQNQKYLRIQIFI